MIVPKKWRIEMSKINFENFEIKDENQLSTLSDFVGSWGEMICSTKERLEKLESFEGNFKNESNSEKTTARQFESNVDRLKTYQEVLIPIVEKKEDYKPKSYLCIMYTGYDKNEFAKYVEILLDFIEKMVPHINSNSEITIKNIIYSDKLYMKNGKSEIEIIYESNSEQSEVFSGLWKQYLKTITNKFEEMIDYE